MLKSYGVESKWFFPVTSEAKCGQSMFVRVRNTYKISSSDTFKRHTYDAFKALLGEAEMERLGIKDGLNSHAGRHIGVYVIIEETGDVLLAAHLLMDSAEMVTKFYANINHKNQAKNLRKLMRNR